MKRYQLTHLLVREIVLGYWVAVGFCVKVMPEEKYIRGFDENDFISLEAIRAMSEDGLIWEVPKDREIFLTKRDCIYLDDTGEIFVLVNDDPKGVKIPIFKVKKGGSLGATFCFLD